MAKKLGIPVVLATFVEDCWSRSHLGSVDLRQVPMVQKDVITFKDGPTACGPSTFWL